MVRNTGIISGLRIGIYLLCFTALAQASENVLISPLAASTPLVTSLPPLDSHSSEWQVSMIVMPELASSLSLISQAYEAQNPIEHVETLTTDCSSLTSSLPENGHFLYATLGQNENSAISFYKCANIESSLLGVLVVDTEKLKDGYQIDTLAYENLKKIKSWTSILAQNLCESGNFVPRLSKCSSHNKYQRSEISDLINKGTDVLEAIIQISSKTGMTQETLDELITYLRGEISCSSTACSGGACEGTGKSSQFVQAATLLFQNAETISTATAANLDSIINAFLCVQYTAGAAAFSDNDMCSINYC
ncbi:hypothetical protein SteCoe_37518 [Stentor coeruleus]|uniref:Uncharacterized protein n=1 Tax=Stentor coeruleus TaxID=5963 RepID=A0A1R2AN42_9CILI|nr:hypothetical protein SteCoe_37518 [Stentor coeruleus]